MKFTEALIKGNIVNVYKNIILDVELDDGAVVPCFCYLDNVLKNITINNSKVYMIKHDDGLRRIKYEAQIIEQEGVLIAVNPLFNEALFKDAVNNGVIADFNDYVKMQKITNDDSAKYASFELTKENGEKLYIYIDTIFRKIGDDVVFPSNMDFMKINVLEEFHKFREEGHATALVHIVPRADVEAAKFVWNIDQVASAKLFDEAKNGLKIYCYGCSVTTNGVEISKKLEII